MKRNLILLISVFFITSGVFAGQPFYYEVISNSSKTIDYTFGFYVNDYTISKASDDKEYVAFSGAVINNSTSNLDWNNYFVIVRTKDGKLNFNYLTAATSGDYDCTFVCSGKETRMTKFCFHDIFKPSDVESVYLFDKSNNKAFQLMYSKND